MKHTRRQLLAHIAQIQNEIGLAVEYAANDQHPNQAGAIAKALGRAHALCIQATATDRPVSPTEMRYLGFRIDPATLEQVRGELRDARERVRHIAEAERDGALTFEANLCPGCCSDQPCPRHDH